MSVYFYNTIVPPSSQGCNMLGPWLKAENNLHCKPRSSISSVFMGYSPTVSNQALIPFLNRILKITFLHVVLILGLRNARNY